MIVSDDAVAAAGVERHLIALGYDVRGGFTSLSEAAASTAEAAPDLVLIDLAGSGAETDVAALTAVRRHWTVPVVAMIEASAEPDLRDAGFAYVVKPVTDRELRVTLQLALCRH